MWCWCTRSYSSCWWRQARPLGCLSRPTCCSPCRWPRTERCRVATCQPSAVARSWFGRIGRHVSSLCGSFRPRGRLRPRLVGSLQVPLLRLLLDLLSPRHAAPQLLLQVVRNFYPQLLQLLETREPEGILSLSRGYPGISITIDTIIKYHFARLETACHIMKLVKWLH